MKNWLLYFFAIIISIFSVSALSSRVYGENSTPKISVLRDGEVTEITVEEYALCVLLHEQESLKSIESKKALAVAARSVGLYLSVFGCKHQDYHACDKGDCCISLGKRDWVSQDALEQCLSAVESTKGQVLSINSVPALSLFCLCNGSGSGDCRELSYLSSVKEDNPCTLHTASQTHPYESLTPLVLNNWGFRELKDNSLLVYGDDKKCEFAILGGKYVSGVALAKALGLPSEFSIEFTENGINSVSCGVGHGYGMSLCGAEKMAESGQSYQNILAKYYPQLDLKKMYNN